MSIPETTEFWWSVKDRFNKPQKHVFIHKKGLDCGHFHVVESKKVKLVDCHACIKILKETIHDYDTIMNPPPPVWPHGNCECGGHFVQRKNGKTNEQFLGCSRFPKCRKTKQQASDNKQ